MANDSVPTSSLVLGFYGEQEIHNNNAKALLDDLIDVHWKEYGKHSEIIFLIPTEPRTDTLSYLAEWCFSSDWTLELIGHPESFEEEEIQRLLEWAIKREVPASMSVARAIVQVLSKRASPHLLLLDDPEEDDDAYEALVAASEISVPVRSLLKGLEKVVLYENDDIEIDDESSVEEEEWKDEEEAEEEEEELDTSDAESDDGDEEEEEVNEEEEDDEESWVDDDDDDELEEDDEAFNSDEEEEESEERKTLVGSTTVPMTERSLLKFFEKDRDGFYEFAAGYGVNRGPGMKGPVMVRRILEAHSGNGAVKNPAAKNTIAKQTPAKKNASKKAAVIKAAPAREIVEKSVSGSSTKAALQLIKAAYNALDAAQELLK